MRLPPSKVITVELISFAFAYLLICLFIIAYSPTALLYVGHDVGPVLDGAWRIESGQIPHKDFSSILGHGYLLQQRFFLSLFQYDFIGFAVSSVVTTTVVFGLFLSLYLSDTFIRNTGFPLRLYLFLLLISLGLGQYHFGIKHTLPTYANLYNRYSFLCLLFLFLQTFSLQDTKRVTGSAMVRLLVIALLLNYLLFIKLTYFLVAAGMLTMCLLLSVISFGIYWRVMISTVILFIGISWGLRADFSAMMQDYRTISSARGGTLLQPSFIKYKFFQYYNFAFLLSLAAMAVELVLKKIPFRFLLLIGFTAASALLLHITNWGATDIVLLTFIPALFILQPTCRKLISFKLFVVICCFFIFKNLRSVYFLSDVNTDNYTELKSTQLSRFYTEFTEVDCGEDYAKRVMSGVSLINKNKKDGERVFSFSFDNPFSFLTQTAPPKNVPIVWQYATTYTYDVYVPAEKLFAEVDLLLIPTCLKAESATEMMKLYGITVELHYSLIDQNLYWKLYRKTKML